MKQTQPGSVEAQIKPGRAYPEGKGVPKNPSQADVVVVSKDKQSSDKLDLNNNFVWYLKTAEQGDAGGQNSPGMIYENGMGVEKDYQQALNWYTKAASQDSPTTEKIAAAEIKDEPEPDKAEPAVELQAEAEIEPAVSIEETETAEITVEPEPEKAEPAAEVTKEIKTASPQKRQPLPGDEEEAPLIPEDKFFALEPQQRESLLEEYNLERLKENAAGADACDEAREWYNEGLDLSDDSVQEAAYYQRAIELCPDFAAAHNRLGEVYKSRGEYESALKEFNQAKKWSLLTEPGIEQRGNRSLLAGQFINQGEIHRMKGRYDLAAEQFKRALRINPGSRVAMNQLQYVNKMSGKYDNIVLPLLQSISSPIFTMTPGMTLPKKVFSFGFLFRYWEQEATLSEDMIVEGEFPDIGRRSLPFERTTDVLQVVLDLRYGLTDNFTIGLFPRWSTIWTNMSLNPSVQQKATGIGDTNLLTKYQFWATRNTRISLFHLLSIPTGDEDAKSEGFGAIVPLGSGSFNFRPGIAFTTKKEYLEAPLTIHSNISYRITNDEVVPDELRCDLAISYPFTIGRARPPAMGGIDPLDITIEEKSGHTLFLSPGFQFILGKDIRLNVGVQIPLIKPEGGWAEKLVVNFGLRGFWDWW
jgi:TPR repeat protein